MNRCSTFLLALMLTLHSYNFAISQQQKEPDRASVCAEIHNSYECALKLETEWLSLLSGKAHRSKDQLSLRLKNGKVILRKDTPGEFEDFDDSSGNTNKKFSLVDYLEKEGYYLLEIGYYEGSAFEFIRLRDGASVIISGIDLQFSPDRKRFAIQDVESLWAEEDQVLEIWRITPTTIKREWRQLPETWPFFNLRWIDSNTIEVFTTEKKLAEIRLDKRGWNIVLPGT